MKMEKDSGLMIAVVMVIMCRGIEAAVYTVGESSGWSMGTDYSTWLTHKTFAPGDTLLFNYGSGHTVDEVSEDDYKTCTTGNAIASDSSGATSITLNKPGPHFFICGVPGHCTGGMKLSLTVAAAAPSGTTTSPPAGTATSPPEPSSTNTVSRTEPSLSVALSPSMAACFITLIVKWFLL